MSIDEWYRIFNAAEYRFYASTSGPPAEDDTPIATNATLPFSPTDTWTTGTVYLSVSYFNGVLDSGFLPIGANGETYLRLDLSAGVALNAPPLAPQNVRLTLRPGGVVHVEAVYVQQGTARATHWAISYTTNGSAVHEPPSGAPEISTAIQGNNLSVLEYDLPAQADGTTVKVRVQSSRNDSGTWRYSEGSTTLTIVADDAAPDDVEGFGIWRGGMPQQQ